jgi:hypothetical protein
MLKLNNPTDATSASFKGLVRFKRTRDDKEKLPELLHQTLRCRRRVAKLKKSYREGLYAEIQNAAIITNGYHKNKEAWQTFVEHRFWEGARPQDCPKMENKLREKLRFVIRFTWKARSGKRCKDASKYCRAALMLLDRGVKLKNLAEKLKIVGIAEANAQQATKRPMKQKKPQSTLASEVSTKLDRAKRSEVHGTPRPLMRWPSRQRKIAARFKIGDHVHLKCEVVAAKDGGSRLLVFAVMASR